MASTKEFLDFVLDQLAEAGDVSYRAMMGEYVLYFGAKTVGGVYDDRLLLKQTPGAIEMMRNAPCGARLEVPYPGASEMIAPDVDDRELVCRLVRIIADELPEPKPKKERGTRMNLADLDGKCVRVTDIHGDVFDGICVFNNADFGEREFGEREVSLEIMNTLFYAGDIASVEVLEDNGGKYGRFRDPYGKIEELTVEDGADAICDALGFDGAEPEHAARLIRCLADRRDAVDEKVDALLRRIALEGDEPTVREAAREFFAASEPN